MAPNTVTRSIKLSLILLTMFICSQSQVGGLKETNLTLYFQDYPAGPSSTPGPNATDIPITGIPGKIWTYTSFGTVFCTDDPLTEGPSASSAQVARGRGTYVTTALDGSSLTLLLSIVFTNNEYNGSTLELQGADPQFGIVREVAVVGGTGTFRYARGYATFQTVFLDPVTSYNVVQFNVSVQHY